MADKNTKAQQELEAMRESHPFYKLFFDDWKFFLSAYEGGKSFANYSNIFKHPRETSQDFQERTKRIHNMNYCEPLVDFFTNFIFSESIDRDGGKNNEFFSEFKKNVNLKGDDVDTFMRQVSDDMQIFGMSYVLVDTPAGITVLSKADELASKIRPYWVLVKPMEIIDWVIDDFGEYQYVKRQQCLDVLGKGGRMTIERFTEFTTEQIIITEFDISSSDTVRKLPIRRIDNQLGKVPLVVSRYKRSKTHGNMGLSFLRDFAYNNREILNLTSLLQEFLYRQAFNILAVEGGQIASAENQSDVIGTSNMLEYPHGAKVPEYITPPADPAEFIQGERSRIQQEMFKRAAQDALNELFNGEKSSGFSQAQSFSKTVPFISCRADELEHVENKLMSLTMDWMGDEWEGKIKYKDRYELTNLSDALTQFQILARDLQVPSETFVKTELKRLVREFDGKLPSDQVVKIDKEIDAMKFTEWQDTQVGALTGRGNSPGDQQKPKGTGTMEEVAAEASKQQPAATNKIKK